MNRIKIAYYILLFISALEFGRGLQLMFNPLFWDPLYSLARFNSMLQIIISALIFLVTRLLKPIMEEKKTD
ncbi:MAG: hypothetical protein P4L35_07865 [Ignavibacteriaceae bacterium]|nr:hypothetical protein [Ignavibacteriaceae bacterium]